MKLRVEFDAIEVEAPDDVATEDALKEWLWQHHKSKIQASMTFPQSTAITSAMKLRLLDTIALVQRKFMLSESAPVVFGYLLEELLDLMDSEYGFIGEIMYDTEDGDGGSMFLQTHAVTNIAWNAATRKFYDDNIDDGLKFYNLNTLFGTVMTSKQPVISNHPQQDKRAGGIPEGHPPLDRFLGIPFFNKHGEMNGMVGVANKPGGYTQADIDFLEPFTVTCSNLIQAYFQNKENKNLINTLEEKVHERTQKLEMINERLEEANRQVKLSSAAQLKHFAYVTFVCVCVGGRSLVLKGRNRTHGWLSISLHLFSFFPHCTVQLHEPRDSDSPELHHRNQQHAGGNATQPHAARLRPHDC